MRLKKFHIIGIGLGLLIIALSFIIIGTKYFFFMMGVGVLIGITPFVVTIIQETNTASEKEEMFLEFARNLVESVKAGTPISRSIMNVRNKPYGVLSENVHKLANQIQLGISLGKALEVFAKDVNNKTVSRALTLIGQAEKAGGDIGQILESVAEAVSMSEKLKKERKATISTLVVEGYIIFVVFIIIILVMQFKILPMVSGIADANIQGIGITGTTSSGGGQDITSSFLYLLLVQGFFSGLVIGKLSEGNLKAGVRHSFALMLMSFLISTGAGLIFG